MATVKQILRYATLLVGVLLPSGRTAQSSAMSAQPRAHATMQFNEPAAPVFNAPVQDSARTERIKKIQAELDTPQEKKRFSNWIVAFKREAKAKGISQETIDAAFPETIAPIASVLERDRNQAEVKKSTGDYLVKVLSEDRIAVGQERLADYSAQLDSMKSVYGVPPQVIVALWGVESNYGDVKMPYEVIPALTTLAFDQRRADMFRKELFAALKMVDKGHIPLADFRGSWAGATGQMQFMPTSFESRAVDFDGDGRKDIWKNYSDIFASAANYLQDAGWKRDAPWGEQVQLPANWNKGLEGYKGKEGQSLTYWKDKGIKRIDGTPLVTTTATKAWVVEGANNTAYLVYSNFGVLRQWNNSDKYATAIGILSDKIKGPQ